MKKFEINREWMETHKKQVAIHSTVLGIFLIYFIFFAGFLQDKLESVPNEARLQNISLPEVTNNIQYFVDQFNITNNTLEIIGWAFIKGEDTQNCKIFIVLKSDNGIYIFDTLPVRREGVTKAFQKLNLNLDWSGFTVVVPMRKIDRGKYQIGIYIRKDNIEALQYIGKTVTK